MRPGGGKQKGSQFERVIAKKLSLWITNGKCDDCFWRSAMSGGRATVAHKKGVDIRQSGDITAVAPEGHALCNLFFIEVKHLSQCDIDAILNDKGNLLHIWKKLRRQAKDHDKLPILILKRNNKPTLWITLHSSPMSECKPRATFIYHNMDVFLLEKDILEKALPPCLLPDRIVLK